MYESTYSGVLFHEGGKTFLFIFLNLDYLKENLWIDIINYNQHFFKCAEFCLI